MKKTDIIQIAENFHRTLLSRCWILIQQGLEETKMAYGRFGTACLSLGSRSHIHMYSAEARAGWLENSMRLFCTV